MKINTAELMDLDRARPIEDIVYEQLKKKYQEKEDMVGRRAACARPSA